MEEKTLKVLEYDKVIEKLSGYATSPVGRELCLKLKPSSGLRRVLLWQKNTTDACERVRIKGAAPTFSGLSRIDDILKRAGIGSVLSAGELLKVNSVLEVSERTRRYGKMEEERADSLSEMFSLITPLPSISREIQRCIPDEDSIADDASPGLFSVRRRMAKAGEDIHSTMAAKLNSLRDYLTDAVITQRDGRWCLPVKAEHKSKVPGIVHDASSTGLTLFIEPQAVVSLNNTLRELAIEEKKEIEQVLKALTESLMPYCDSISEDIKTLARLDVIFAKALYSAAIGGSEPVFSNERKIDLKEARHPLIPEGEVVPINIKLGGGFSLLVITGPNTGGKTVSLKTAGLLTLMAQAGLHIPALPGSCAGIYNDIYADIGDEQSIEQSLSTFSSHMTNIVYILKKAGSGSLCLFDELGSGTDPTEGAALGTSILDYMLRKKIHAMATTHYAEIKAYALTAKGVENACCEFDVDSLKPTYRLLMGIPGKSNAFAISERLGLPKDIIEDARTRVSTENKDFEGLIEKLNEDRTAAIKAREEAEKMETEALILRDRLKESQSRLEKNREKVLEEARKEARKVLKEAKDTADEAIKNINSAKTPADLKKAEHEREKLKKQLDKAGGGGTLKSKGPSKPVSPKKLKEGDTVRVMPMGGAVGKITRLPDSSGCVTVQIGFMNSRVNVRDIEYAGPDAVKEASKREKALSSGRENISYAPRVLSVSPEINLIGMTSDEAEAELGKYLDEAYLAGLNEVRIVHGRGTGVLKAAVHAMLKKLKYVESYRLGAYGEGDMGVTIAKLR